ncbi:substrate-binding domain-containing protein [Nitrospinota bacterium]
MKKNVLKWFFWSTVALVFTVGFPFLPVAAAETLTIKGSDTMVILSQRWTVKEFRVAMDGLAVVVSAKNPVSELSLKQLMGVYIGHFNNWKQVGGPDKKILRYCRESNSGTYVFFKDNVLKKRDYAADCQTLPGTAAVAEAVTRDKWGIGYGGIAYFSKRLELKILAVRKKSGGPAVSPLTPSGEINIKAVKTGKYPIARFLNVYSLGEPKGLAKKFMDWVMGPEGQTIVGKIGYVPVVSMTSASN